MAGKVGSVSFSVLLADGYNLLPSKPQTFTYKTEALNEPSHGLGDSTEAATPTGLSNVTIAQTGAFFDDTANGMHDALKASQATKRILTFAMAGNTIGQCFYGLEGEYGNAYDVQGQMGKLTKANVAYALNGDVNHGQIIQSWTQKSGSWNTKTDGTPVDFTAWTSQRVIPITSNSKASASVVTCPAVHGLTSGDTVLIAGVVGSSPTVNGSRVATVLTDYTFSVPVDTSGAGSAGTGGSFVRVDTAGGCVGYLEVSELTGITGFAGVIKGSTDNTTFTPLVTFASVTAAQTAQRVVVTGSIPRYLSFVGTFTGTGTITVFCGLART